MTPPIAQRQVQVTNEKGVHMRPSTRFVKLAGSFRSDVRVRYDGKDVNGKSILDMTTLGAECGALLEISAEGDDAEDAVTALAGLVSRRFDMPDDGDGEAA